MQRILPLVAAQARPRLIGEPVSAFADEVKAALEAKPHSKLVVFPELHLFGDGNPDLQRTEMLCRQVPNRWTAPRQRTQTARRGPQHLAGPRQRLRTRPGRPAVQHPAGAVPGRGARRLLPEDLPLAPVRALRSRRPVHHRGPARHRQGGPEHLLRRLVPGGVPPARLDGRRGDPQRRQNHHPGPPAGAGPRQGQRHRQPGVRGQRQLRRPHRPGPRASSSTPRATPSPKPRTINRCCSPRNWTWPPSNTSARTARRTSTAPGRSSARGSPPSNFPSTKAGSIRPPGHRRPTSPKETP
jgi:hypothetical protein